jgi:hypothetical protein
MRPALRSTAYEGPLAGSSVRRTNWRSAHRRTFGPAAGEGWLEDLDPGGAEVYAIAGEAMVMVDRTPIHTDADRNAFVRKSVALGGVACLNLVDGPFPINDMVTHGVYSGKLGELTVHMDQFVSVRNGVPVGVVRVLQRADRPLEARGLERIMRRFLGKELALAAG